MNGKFWRSLAFFFVYLVALNVYAQTRCPVGVQAGNAQCLPDDEEGTAPSRPTGEWIKTWGALVSSNEKVGAWSSNGKFTESDARQEALSACRSAGASDCNVDATYFNQCVAVVGSDERGVTIGKGKNEKVASAVALDGCKKSSKSGCHVQFTECTDPFFRKF